MTTHPAPRRTHRPLPLTTLLLTCSLALTGCESGNDSTAPSPRTSTATATASAGTALRAVADLTVKGRAPKTGYDREKFGPAWADTDHNGCGTRDDVLAHQLSSVSRDSDGCKVTRGVLLDPYTGARLVYIRGHSQIDIDHLVPLSDAWQKGAQRWSDSKRRTFANDSLNLMAVDASTNRRKGDGDTATWLPPKVSYRCEYVARQAAVKKKYGLWVTRAEKDAMAKVLGVCPNQKLPSGGSPR